MQALLILCSYHCPSSFLPRTVVTACPDRSPYTCPLATFHILWWMSSYNAQISFQEWRTCYLSYWGWYQNTLSSFQGVFVFFCLLDAWTKKKYLKSAFSEWPTTNGGWTRSCKSQIILIKLITTLWDYSISRYPREIRQGYWWEMHHSLTSPPHMPASLPSFPQVLHPITLSNKSSAGSFPSIFHLSRLPEEPDLCM